MDATELIADFEQKLATLQTDEERCTLYRDIGRKLTGVNLPMARVYVEKYIALSKQTGIKTHECFSICQRGLISFMDGDNTTALKDFNESLLKANEIEDNAWYAAFIYDKIAGVYMETFFFDEAVENYQRAIELFEQAGHKKPALGAEHNLAVTYYRASMFDKAREIYLKLIAEGAFLEFCYLKLYYDYVRTGEFDKAAEALAQCGRHMTEHTPSYQYHQFYLINADHLSREGKVDEAKEYFTKARETARSYNSLDTLLNSELEEGKFFLNLSDWENANDRLVGALDVAKSMNVKQSIADVLNWMKELNFKQGKFLEALDFANQYIALEKEIKIEQAENIKRLIEVKQNFTMVRREKELSEKQNVALTEKNIIIEEERKRSDELLLNILPGEVAEELKAKGEYTAKLFDDVTVMFTDFKNFTIASERFTPQEIVNELHTCFKAFDEIMAKYRIEKIKTIGDGYVAVSGLPVTNPHHASDALSAAIEIRDFMLNREKELGNDTFEMRVGLHSGKVIAGIVGVKKYTYDIWGDTVNTAARMEQHGEPGKINISGTTYARVKDHFLCTYRGKIEAKNKGEIDMYFVETAKVNGIPAAKGITSLVNEKQSTSIS